jgi:ribosome biogenesis GTPase A
LDKNKNELKILLVYHKNDIGDKNETATWKKIIKDNYKGYNFLN